VRAVWREPVVVGLAAAAGFSWWLFVFGGAGQVAAWIRQWPEAKDTAWRRAGLAERGVADGAVAVMVNGEPITLPVLEQRTELHLAYFRLGGGTEASYAEIRPLVMMDVLREMIDERLVQQEMRRRRAAPAVGDEDVAARLRQEAEGRGGTTSRLEEELRRAGLSADHAARVLRDTVAGERFIEQHVLRGVPEDDRPLAYYSFLSELRNRARVEGRFAEAYAPLAR
jgi:hypothetical protein